MLKIISESGDRLDVQASGKLTRADYEELVPHVEERLEAEGKLRCMVRLRDFHGWTIGALLEELKFDLRHRNDFDRVAVVGQRAREKLGTQLSRLLLSRDVRFYEEEEELLADAWLQAPRGFAARTRQATRQG